MRTIWLIKMLQLRWHFCGASFDCLPFPLLIWVLQVRMARVLVAGWQAQGSSRRRLHTTHMLTEVR